MFLNLSIIYRLSTFYVSFMNITTRKTSQRKSTDNRPGTICKYVYKDECFRQIRRWIVRYVRKGHNKFTTTYLYNETEVPLISM